MPKADFAKWPRAGEIARVILFLCSDEARVIHGAAIPAGETAQRLFLLDAWREAPLYSERERAALAWTEAVTLIGEEGASDEVYAQARAAFDEKELVRLTLAIISINGWNRLSIAFRMPPTYERPAK